MSSFQRRTRGFSLIEVLISLVIISIGVLGMVAMQSRTIKFTQDAELQNNAAMLADELVEMMRSNLTGALAADKFSTGSNYYKALGTAFGSTGSSACPGRDRSAGGSTVASTDLGCWVRDVQANLPVTTSLLTSSFAVCPSSSTVTSASTSPCGAAASSSTVVIQIAWKDPSGACGASAGGTPICIYRLRTEL